MNRFKIRKEKEIFIMEEQKKRFDRKCKYCGYTNRVMNHFKREPCKHCGRYVFLNDKDEFIYRIKEKL